MGLARWQRVLLLALIIAAIGYLVFVNFCQTIKWVGFTSVDVTFVVTDSDGTPIPDAEIKILGSKTGGLCEPDKEDAFVLKTDAKGTVSATRGCMCFGTLGVGVNTFASHLPSWSLQASAKGFRRTDWFALDELGRARRAIEGQNDRALLEIRIRLDKLPDIPGRRP